MEQIVVKTEVQPNGDILLFYVDESRNEEENDALLEQQSQQYLQNESVMLHENKYVIAGVNDSVDVNETNSAEASGSIDWDDEETKKLLIFYIDNKEAFLSGGTKTKHLWVVACKTMLRGKTHQSCELQLKNLMEKYTQILSIKQAGGVVVWALFKLCHQAFCNTTGHNNTQSKNNIEASQNVQITHSNEDGILISKKKNPPNTDEKVEMMLNLYLKHRKKFQKNESQRGLWELIVLEMGEQDVDYWHRRFLNFKQHYVKMLHKQKENGTQSIIWPYMKIFDQIFQNDEEFHRKFTPQSTFSEQKNENIVAADKITSAELEWSDMDKTFLTKYYFDCFHEFEDPTIPNKFLWNEVGRFLAKKGDVCKDKFMELKNAHFNKVMAGGYNLVNRIPMEIILDNIIAKETELELEKSSNGNEQPIPWKIEQIDDLVQYLYDNAYDPACMIMLKDPVCCNVCWAVLAKKLHKSCQSCKKQWVSLTALYKSILNDKKENPDMTIDWRYIEIFDRIFDYGMATNLLDACEKSITDSPSKSSKIGVKKITIGDDDTNSFENGTEDEASYDERGFTKYSKKHVGDAKAFKILEFYLKNKNKFASSQYKRVALWETLSKQIGISATECAHRFRNFKQVYKGYVKREISKPEKPILWPYYALCKKIFGYRTIKAKLKNEIRAESDDEDWSPKEIKTLISHFGLNFDYLHDKLGDSSKWIDIASEIGRSNTACRDKLMELRKSYRKLKTMKSRNPQVKLSWKYFNLMDKIYSKAGADTLDDVVMSSTDENSDLAEESDIKQELQDEDYTIIVIPEGGEMNDLDSEHYITGTTDNIQEYTEEMQSLLAQTADSNQEAIKEEKPVLKWTKGSKKRLLILYLNYLRAHKGKEIKPKDMWTEIASKFGDRKPITCKKMFMKLKERHKQAVAEDIANPKTPYFTLFEKILSLKPKFERQQSKVGEGKIYKDYPLDDAKVELALKYYLQNIDEFISPKFEKKYLWTELANYISEPVSKIFNKVNYLIQFYKSNTLEAENTRFGEILKEIFIKENLLNDVPNDSKVLEEEIEYTWTEDEIEILLTWYLAHLEKFKNPKFVRSYLWMEASDILKKSPWACSNKMSEIRTQYRTMVKENPDGLNEWRFSTLCQRIYGTGKKNQTTIEINLDKISCE